MTRDERFRHAGDAGRAGAFGYLEIDASVMRGLCAALERIADGLPDTVAPAEASRTARALPAVLGGHCALYDGLVIPLLLDAASGEVRIVRAAEQAGREHREALGQAVELGEALEELAATGRTAHPERLGLMLRATFESLDRHLRWEQLVLIEDAGRLLPGHARARLARHIVDTRLDDLIRWRREGFTAPDGHR